MFLRFSYDFTYVPGPKYPGPDRPGPDRPGPDCPGPDCPAPDCLGRETGSRETGDIPAAEIVFPPPTVVGCFFLKIKDSRHAQLPIDVVFREESDFQVKNQQF